jgi:hypothetical protein
LDALSVGIERKKVNWVLDADLRDFFSSLDHSWLEKFLEHRIADKSGASAPALPISVDGCSGGTWNMVDARLRAVWATGSQNSETKLAFLERVSTGFDTR